MHYDRNPHKFTCNYFAHARKTPAHARVKTTTTPACHAGKVGRGPAGNFSNL